MTQTSKAWTISLATFSCTSWRPVSQAHTKDLPCNSAKSGNSKSRVTNPDRTKQRWCLLKENVEPIIYQKTEKHFSMQKLPPESKMESIRLLLIPKLISGSCPPPLQKKKNLARPLILINPLLYMYINYAVMWILYMQGSENIVHHSPVVFLKWIMVTHGGSLPWKVHTTSLSLHTKIWTLQWPLFSPFLCLTAL